MALSHPNPRFMPHTITEAARHASYLLVTVVPWPAAKSAFLTTVEWHTRTALPASFLPPPATHRHGTATFRPRAAPTTEPVQPPRTAEPVRVRTLVEREPLNAIQARERAESLAHRNGIPIVFTVGC